MDEIHRFNKAQQDAFLQHVESGLITLIGATTENPSFEVIPALLSRCRLIILKALSPVDLKNLLVSALEDPERGLGKGDISITADALEYIVDIADGDARRALNGLEISASLADGLAENLHTNKTIQITLQTVEKAVQKTALSYDKNGEEHYNIISAFHKSLRGSDPDGAVYWLGRRLQAGEDPLYPARRMVRFASEDVGNADPQALGVALSAMEAFRFLGRPEGDLALFQAAVYLAAAPKSNSIYATHGMVKDVIDKTGALPVPLHIRNAPTKLMRDIGYGKNYKYAHDYPGAFVAQEYLPEKLRDKIFYIPTERGYEKAIKDFDYVIKSFPRYAYVYMNRGNAFAGLGEHELADKDYSKAEKLDPQYATANYINEGLAYMNSGEYELAIEAFTQSITASSDIIVIYSGYYNRAVSYEALGKDELAIEDYSNAIEVYSQDADAFTNRGLAYVKLGLYERAIKDFDQAIKIDSQDAEVYYSRGIVYYNLGEYERAIENVNAENLVREMKRSGFS